MLLAILTFRVSGLAAVIRAGIELHRSDSVEAELHFVAVLLAR